MSKEGNLLYLDEILECQIFEWDKQKKDISREEFFDYQSFFKNYLIKNTPCIIKNIPFQEWYSYQNWIENNKPNINFLRDNYGNSKVPIANCKEKYYNSQIKSEMDFSQFLDYWQKFMKNQETSLLYLKDWHFTYHHPQISVYRIPKFFASDWLNEFLCLSKEVEDDYRFVYMGPKNSWTPFHADVFSSFSWSINLCGRKRWLLYPPGQEEHLKDSFNNLAYDVLSDDLKNIEKYPNYSKVECVLDIVQETGEAIFVPSGWHHQVWNLDETISINHNWINGCNIINMWKALQAHLKAVYKEIEDCRDMDDWLEHCQIMLKVSFGMNYQDFLNFLMFIAKRRLNSLENNQPLYVLGDWILNENHILFDLKQIRSVLLLFINDENVKKLKFISNLEEEHLLFVEKIDATVNKNK